jgi:hypothetical protein
MIELTDAQATALETTKGPIQLLNPHSGEVFVLVRKDVYDITSSIIDGPNRKGWDDPELDVYKQFRKKKK